MKNRPRKRYTLDGFQPRPRVTQKPVDKATAARSISFDDQTSFQPRQTVVSQQNQPLPDSDETIELDDADLQSIESEKSGRLKKDQKPKFWQLRKRREWRREHPLSKKAKILRRIGLVILLLIILVGGWFTFKILTNAAKVIDGNIFNILDTTKLKGEENGRVNILLVGTSEDSPDHENALDGGGATLTDSIMIISFDTVNKKAFVMSIPRDLWVDYDTRDCDIGYSGKINAVYECGELTKFSEPGYPAGGMGLLAKVIKRDLGLDINYYGKVGYEAFKKAVDNVGGIDITIKTDDPRGILDRNFDWHCKYQCYLVKYPNGPVHLNGQQALDLARARGAQAQNYGTGNDFGRTERQRQMLFALKDKTLSGGTLANPIAITNLMDTIGNNVKTDFKANELKRLYDLGKDIKSDQIKSIGLADEEVALVTTGDYAGQSIVRPTAGLSDFSQIKLFIKKLTSNDPVVREAPTVTILNGSGQIGLAQRESDALEAKGITVSGVGNAAAARETTVVFDARKGAKPGSKSLLEKRYGVTAQTEAAQVAEAESYQTDFIIILGKNYSASSDSTGQ